MMKTNTFHCNENVCCKYNERANVDCAKYFGQVERRRTVAAITKWNTWIILQPVDCIDERWKTLLSAGIRVRVKMRYQMNDCNEMRRRRWLKIAIGGTLVAKTKVKNMFHSSTRKFFNMKRKCECAHMVQPKMNSKWKATQAPHETCLSTRKCLSHRIQCKTWCKKQRVKRPKMKNFTEMLWPKSSALQYFVVLWTQDTVRWCNDKWNEASSRRKNRTMAKYKVFRREKKNKRNIEWERIIRASWQLGMVQLWYLCSFLFEWKSKRKRQQLVIITEFGSVSKMYNQTDLNGKCDKP